jgi:predicted MFS family arabinose efflux permease
VGKLLVVVGLVITGIGLLVMLGVPVGRLPGDLTVKRGNFTFYFPLATSIVASILLTLLLSLLRR